MTNCDCNLGMLTQEREQLYPNRINHTCPKQLSRQVSCESQECHSISKILFALMNYLFLLFLILNLPSYQYFNLLVTTQATQSTGGRLPPYSFQHCGRLDPNAQEARPHRAGGSTPPPTK